MASVNKVILVGNVGTIDSQITQSGLAVTRLSLATNEKFKDKDHTEWHQVTAFGRRAEVLAEYVKVGDPLYVEGRLRTRKYTNKHGDDAWATGIIADNFQFLRGKRSQEPDYSSDAPSDIPF